MARRSALGNALAGFSDAYDMVGKIGQDMELAKLGREGATDSVDPETGVKTTTFLGKQYEGGLSQDQIDAARTQRMTDIVGKYDPMRGLEMRRGLKRDAREDKAFDLQQRTGEASLKGMEQTQKLTDYKLNEAKDTDELRGKRREFSKQLTGMTNEQLAAHVGDAFSNDPNVPAMLDYDKKTNRFNFVSKIPGMPSQSFTRAELMQQATALWEQGNGDFHSGLNMQLQALKDQHQRQREQVGDARDAAHGNAQLAYQDRMYGLNAAHLALARQKAEEDRSRMYGVEMGYMPGANGELQPVLAGLRNSGKNGAVEGVSVNLNDKLPGGFIPERAFGGVGKTAAGLVGQETGQLDAKGGKVLYTPETAEALARQQVIRSYTGRGGSQGGGIDPAVLAKMGGLLNPAAQQAPAPNAAQALPASQQQGIRATFGSSGLRMPSASPAQGAQVMIQNGRPVPVMVDPGQQPMTYEEALRYLR